MSKFENGAAMLSHLRMEQFLYLVCCHSPNLLKLTPSQFAAAYKLFNDHLSDNNIALIHQSFKPQKKSGIDYFNALRPSEYWKFFTDACCWNHKDQEFVFDRDDSPGYFKHCSIALAWMLLTLNKPVDLDYIITLRNFAYPSDSIISRHLVLSACSGIGRSSFTVAGLKELIKAEQQRSTPLFELTCDRFQGSLPEIASSTTAEEILSAINKATQKNRVTLRRSSKSIEDVENTAIIFLDNYRKDIDSAQSDSDRLTAIVKVIQNLHQFHPFADGNGRTFCFFLLNRLLLDNGLPPTIIKVPGYFTGWAVEELVNEVKEGQKRFESLCSPSAAHIPLVETIERRISCLSKKTGHWFNYPAMTYYIQQPLNYTHHFFTSTLLHLQQEKRNANIYCQL